MLVLEVILVLLVLLMDEERLEHRFGLPAVVRRMWRREDQLLYRGWFQRAIHVWSDERFCRTFRMSRQVFLEIFNKVNAGRRLEGLKTDMQQPVPGLVVFAITIVRLSSNQTFHYLAEMFGYAPSTCHKCYKKGLLAINQLERKYIRETTKEEHMETMKSIYLAGMKGH